MTQAYGGAEIAWRPLAYARLQGGDVRGLHDGVAFRRRAAADRGDVHRADRARARARSTPCWHNDDLGIDWRPSPGYARRGGLYQVRYHRYAGGVDDFERVEGEVVQHVPLVRENWVLSLHGHADSILSDDAVVPYLPSLGGGDTLRGYSGWQFP